MAEPLDTTLACAFCGKTFALTEEHNCQIRELVNDLRIDRDAVRAELAAANSRIAELERRYGNAFSMFQSAQNEVAALSARLERVQALADEHLYGLKLDGVPLPEVIRDILGEDA